MTYTVFSEDRKSLQFPAFCDGYVNIDYSEAVAGEPTGVWANEGSFTVEMLVTPYDVNGDFDYDAGTSHKSLKSLGSDGDDYFDRDERKNAVMTLLKNTNIKVSLNNTSLHRKQQPAEYSISFTMTIGGTTTTLTSPTVITTNPLFREVYKDPTKYLFNGHEPFAEKANHLTSYDTISSVNTGANSFTTDTVKAYRNGITIYDNFGNNLGINEGSEGSSTIRPSNGIEFTFDDAYIPLPQEAQYVETVHHIAVSYDSNNKLMSIIYNNNLVAQTVHDAGGKFVFHPSDIYLGKDPFTGSAQDKRKSQFIGEYHEMSITSISSTKFTNINTLTPPFRRLLLYLDFEESNLDG